MRLVLISLDAVARPDADRLLSLPALSALKEQGVFCKNVKTVYPTLTYPIHASAITGCYPDRHCVAHNQPFQPDKSPNMRAWYWEIGQIGQRTLWEAANEQGLDVASILWPVSGRAGRIIRRNFPEILPLSGENATLKMLKYASPFWILRMECLYGKQRRSIRQPDLDDYAALLCEKLILSKRPPDVLTVHLVDCDSMRHWYGTDSLEAHEAMQRLDARVRKITDALKKASLYDDTILCIMSDHGQEDAKASIQLDALLQAECGARAQTLGMGAYIFGDEAKALSVLTRNQNAWHISHIYSDVELRSLRAPKNVHLAVEAEAGFRFSDGDESGDPHIGEHGFSLDRAGGRTLLWLAGRPFKKNVELDDAEIVDIAPTLAHALQLSMPNADGRVLKEALVAAKEESI